MNKEARKNQILNIYQQFQNKLNHIDVEGLEKHFTRKELLELNDAIFEITSIERSIRTEIRELADKIKLEERPALLGVYRFPILNEIDFLVQDVKVALDKHLAKLYKGNRLTSLPNDFPNDMVEQTIEWLISHDVISKQYQIECQCGQDDSFFEVIDIEDYNKDKESYLHVRKVVANYSNEPEEEAWDAEMELDRLHRYYTCDDCDDNLAYRLFVHEEFSSSKKAIYTMNMSPDFSLEQD